MSYVTAYYHIVITTYNRENTINEENCENLYRFIWSRIQHKRCRLIRINGTANHVHILVDLCPSISLSNFMMDIKSVSSKWLKGSGMFPKFRGWSKEYFAVSVSQDKVSQVKDYIMAQKEHHKRVHFMDEFDKILREHGFDPMNMR